MVDDLSDAILELMLVDVYPILQDLPEDTRGLGLLDYNWQASNFTVSLMKSALSKASREWVVACVKYLKSDTLVSNTLRHVRMSLNPPSVGNPTSVDCQGGM